LERKVTNYFYVNGKEPSGVPDALVVEEKEARGTMNLVKENE
jgi:hypothetical protein